MCLSHCVEELGGLPGWFMSLLPSAVQGVAGKHLPGGRGDALSRECWKPLCGPVPYTVRMKGLKLREGKILSQSHTAGEAGGGLRLADPWPGALS